MNQEHISPELEFSYIVDGIYVGNNLCCQTHFDERLKRDGISADISLEEERLDEPKGVEFYLWLPVKNLSAPTQDQLDLGVANLQSLVTSGRKVYVHCRNGHGRAPTLVAAYLIKKGLSAEEAIAFIKEKRPAVHLEESQIEALKDFYRKAAGTDN